MAHVDVDVKYMPSLHSLRQVFVRVTLNGCDGEQSIHSLTSPTVLVS